MVGYNDTKQTPHAFGGEKEDLWNFNPLGLQLWNSIRALDFVESLPEVDKMRLGATGASGGGTQTFLLAAVDDRVQVDVPVNMISGIMQGGSPCENAPGLRHDTLNVEFGAMMAPRPMLMVAATGDWTKNVPRVEYPAIRAIYALYDAAPQVEQVQFDSPHNYHQGSREAMYTFFARRFLGKDGPVKEEPYQMETDADFLVWNGRSMPPGALDFEGVFRAWRELTTLKSPNREALLYALSAEVPANVLSESSGETVTLTRPQRGDRVTGIYVSGKGDPVVVVHPQGAKAAQSAAPVSPRPVLYLDVWNASRDTGAKYFTTFHRTDSQNRVQDILTAIAWMRARHSGTVEVRASGKAAVWATYAAAADTGARLRAETTGFTGTDDAFVKDFFVPGLQRTGGWKSALALARR
jgi:dienelactone hydrolase